MKKDKVVLVFHKLGYKFNRFRLKHQAGFTYLLRTFALFLVVLVLGGVAFGIYKVTSTIHANNVEIARINESKAKQSSELEKIKKSSEKVLKEKVKQEKKLKEKTSKNSSSSTSTESSTSSSEETSKESSISSSSTEISVQQNAEVASTNNQSQKVSSTTQSKSDEQIREEQHQAYLAEAEKVKQSYEKNGVEVNIIDPN